jgi:hypothetical protein
MPFKAGSVIKLFCFYLNQLGWLSQAVQLVTHKISDVFLPHVTCSMYFLQLHIILNLEFAMGQKEKELHRSYAINFIMYFLEEIRWPHPTRKRARKYNSSCHRGRKMDNHEMMYIFHYTNHCTINVYILLNHKYILI